ESVGQRIALVNPTGPNFKLTTAEDLIMAEALLQSQLEKK
ncbi:hypothetical protein GF377_07940, partial [candidate division GN15 bacterium]|nr:hypothetical protein [candidate division GN15 bacterium]